MNYRIFVINPGSTSTKIALIENESVVFSENVSHDAKKLSEFEKVSEQLPYRMLTIKKILNENKISLNGINACVGRGGGLLPLEGGTYEIDDMVYSHAENPRNGVEHPAQLGVQLAAKFADMYGCRAFTVNPPDVDEYDDIARITGIKGIYRQSHMHSLNLKETAIRHSEKFGRKYEECSYIVCHIGGGVSISAHKNGYMVDGTDIVKGDGPMAPTRCGSIPAADLIELCFSVKSKEEVKNLCTKTGGFVSHLGTSDALEIFNRAKDGDMDAKMVWEAMIYQIGKSIGSMAPVLRGQIDGILLGGGIVYNKELVEKLTEMCSFIAPVFAYPGEFEMEAMAQGAIRVLSGKEKLKVYTGIPIRSREIQTKKICSI